MVLICACKCGIDLCLQVWYSSMHASVVLLYACKCGIHLCMQVWYCSMYTSVVFIYACKCCINPGITSGSCVRAAALVHVVVRQA